MYIYCNSEEGLCRNKMMFVLVLERYRLFFFHIYIHNIYVLLVTSYIGAWSVFSDIFEKDLKRIRNIIRTCETTIFEDEILLKSFFVRYDKTKKQINNLFDQWNI